MAIRRRKPAPGLIHHSDRGGSYSSDEYLAILRLHAMQISMCRAGTPSDNAICERFMRTLKDEEIRVRGYIDHFGRENRLRVTSTIPITIVGCIPASAIGRRQSSKACPSKSRLRHFQLNLLYRRWSQYRFLLNPSVSSYKTTTMSSSGYGGWRKVIRTRRNDWAAVEHIVVGSLKIKEGAPLPVSSILYLTLALELIIVPGNMSGPATTTTARA